VNWVLLIALIVTVGTCSFIEYKLGVELKIYKWLNIETGASKFLLSLMLAVVAFIVSIMVGVWLYTLTGSALLSDISRGIIVGLAVSLFIDFSGKK